MADMYQEKIVKMDRSCRIEIYLSSAHGLMKDKEGERVRVEVKRALLPLIILSFVRLPIQQQKGSPRQTFSGTFLPNQ